MTQKGSGLMGITIDKHISVGHIFTTVTRLRVGGALPAVFIRRV
jgi:hypothetical protein